MKLTKEQLELEIKNSKTAMAKHEEGIALHKIVLKAFEEELNKYS